MAPPSLRNILASQEDGIALIKWNRPKHANALDDGIGDDLLAALRWADREPSVRVIVLTGVGKFFCAGMDLKDVPDKGPVLPDPNVATLSATHELLINSSKVLIAAVNGPAVGYGTSILSLFDLVYSVPEAYFFTPFVKWGLCAEACSSVTFMRIMGRQKAAAMILAGERITAQELSDAGLVTKVLPKENFVDQVLKIARRINEQPPGAVKFNKDLMMRPLRQELLEANARECQGLRDRGRTDEPRNAIAAFEQEQITRRKSAKL